MAAMTHTWPDVLNTLVAGDDLTAEQAAWAMGEVGWGRGAHKPESGP